jgi:hypothetical protein
MTKNTKLQDEDQGKPLENISWKEFLESYPTGTWQTVSGFYEINKDPRTRDLFTHISPPLSLFCSICEGIQNFDGEWKFTNQFTNKGIINDYVIYRCRNCQKFKKTYCIISHILDDEGIGKVYKIGEMPEVHTEGPKSLLIFLGDDYHSFMKGLKCEKQGLGIGAFTYYRRVVETQKHNLINEIERVALKLNASPEFLQSLIKAKKETRFTLAIDQIKGAIPESLLVDSHNPLKLLHKALSIGVHEETDETCLQLAHNVRLVLFDLFEKLQLALSDQKELNGAVAGLLKFNSKPK